MPVRPPSEETLQEHGEQLWLDLSDAEIEAFLDLAEEFVEQYETVEAYEPRSRLGGTEVRERSSGRRPGQKHAGATADGSEDTAEDPHNAWVTRCTVRGSDDGPLADWDVAIKDNVCVAGVEMTCGSAVVEGYVPNVDATVVTRLLEAGADVVGKTNMDDMAMSTSGHSAFGPITNPRDDDYLAGGSSAGSAVVVATGEVDAAIGTDQGGSIRIPAAHCGVVGHKPTYGLVPYTGSVGMEHVVDHPGPIAADVETTARTLTVLAGGSEHDPRQPAELPDEQYAESLTGDVSDRRIGVLEEGFDRENGDEAVDDVVRGALDRLEDAGSTVEEVSIPIHRDASAIHSVLSSEGLVAAMNGEGLGHGAKAWYNTAWVDAFGKFRRAHGGEFPATLKLSLLMGAYTSRSYHSRYYAKAMNLVLEMVDRYDAALETFDVLAMPAAPETAPERDEEASELERLRQERTPGNTSAFNRTGHPAVSVPAGTADGLPVGLMLVGERFADDVVLDVAHALERAQ